MSAADHDTVAALIAEQETAWNDGDAVAYSRRIAADCVFTNIFGSVFVGHAGFEAQHAAIFAGIYRGTRLQLTIDHLRFPRPDIAIVDTTARVTGWASLAPGLQAQDGALVTRLVQVLVKDDGEWHVASYHNVDVKTLPPRR